MTKKVLLCGPFPSPIGGVSIHIQRLSRFLAKQGYIVLRCDESPKTKAGIFNLRSCHLLRYVGLVRASGIVHVHSSIHIFRLLHILVASLFRKKIVVTIHSWRAGNVILGIWRLILKVAPISLIFVSEEIKIRFGLPGVVLPAYINPDIAVEEELPNDLTSWIAKNRFDNSYLAVSNAYRLVENKNQDLYGVDMCIDVAKKIKSLVFVFVVANPECAREKIALYRDEIVAADMENRFLIYEGSVSFVKLLSMADISVRATNTDGDALSVRESLFLNCKTIASDVSFRPDGVFTFANRDVLDLESKINQLIVDHAEARAIKSVPEDCTRYIIDVYDSSVV